MAVTPTLRAEQKLRTRRALLDGALRLLEEQSLDGLGLREVAREAGLSPTGFYRHFPDIESLGVALVEESFGALREMLRTARSDPVAYGDAINRSVFVLNDHVQRQRPEFRFVCRERFSGMQRVRVTIRQEIRLFESELATDLVRVPELERWGADDLRLLASILVDLAISTVEELLEVPSDRPDQEAAVVRRAQHRLRMVVLGVLHWRPHAATSG